MLIRVSGNGYINRIRLTSGNMKPDTCYWVQVQSLLAGIVRKKSSACQHYNVCRCFMELGIHEANVMGQLGY